MYIYIHTSILVYITTTVTTNNTPLYPIPSLRPPTHSSCPYLAVTDISIYLRRFALLEDMARIIPGLNYGLNDGGGGGGGGGTSNGTGAGSKAGLFSGSSTSTSCQLVDQSQHDLPHDALDATKHR